VIGAGCFALQRSPIRACCVANSNKFMVSACGGGGSSAAGSDTSIIVWDTLGQPLAFVGSPHPQGTCSIAISKDDSLLVSLSMPFADPSNGGVCQELSIWDLSGVCQRTSVSPRQQHSHIHDEEKKDGADSSRGNRRHEHAGHTDRPQFVGADEEPIEIVKLASSAIPIADAQHVVTFNSSSSATVLTSDRSWNSVFDVELATTGTGSVVFWLLSKTIEKRQEGVAYEFQDDGVAGMASSPGGQPGGLASTMSSTRRLLSDTITRWTLRSAPARVPGAASSQNLTAVAARAQMDLGDDDLFGQSVTGGATAAHTAGSTAALLSRRALRRQATVTLFTPPVSAGTSTVNAVTGSDDGTLIMWAVASDASSGILGGSAAGGADAVVTVDDAERRAYARITRIAAKNVKLTKSEAGAGGASAKPAAGQRSGSPERGGATASIAAATESSGGINSLKLSPDQNLLLVASEDGAIRVYDLHLRLVAWYEELNAGPLVSLNFVPGSEVTHPRGRGGQDQHRPSSTLSGGSAGTHSTKGGSPSGRGAPQKSATATALEVMGSLTHGSSDDPNAPAANKGFGSLELPDFVVVTRRCLVVHVVSASFDSLNPMDRRGTILLEGPDDAVVGLAAYPGAPRLAVAVASGIVQVWDSETKSLLVVRELARELSFQEQQLLQPFGAAGRANARVTVPLHPTCIAIDPAGRFIAVGTQEGYICFIDPDDLSDTQPPLAPPHHGIDSGLVVTAGGGSPTASGGAHTSAAASAPASPVTRLSFSEDGLHLATTDQARHVSLHRYTRTRIRQVSATATSRLKLAGTVAGAGFRAAAAASSQASQAGGRPPRSWELIDGDESGLEEVITDTWAFIGRAKSHSQEVSGIAFNASHSATVGHNLVGNEIGHEGASFWPRHESGGLSLSDLIEFHRDHGISILASIGADRRLVLYDVGASSVVSGLIIAGENGPQRVKVEQSAIPTAFMWYPPAAPLPDTESDHDIAATSLLVANDQYKLKLVRHTQQPSAPVPARASMTAAAASNAAATISCRKTILGPTFGGAISHLAPLHTPVTVQLPPLDAPGDADTPPAAREVTVRTVTSVAFGTNDRVVGVMALAPTGNPFAIAGVVAHPGPVTGLSVSHDGASIFSCGRDSYGAEAGSTSGRFVDPVASACSAVVAASGGGSAGNVCIWHFDGESLDAQLTRGGTGVAPFMSLLEGGEKGQLYQEICDFFSYAQIRSQGETSTAKRRAGISLPLSELPAVMRALGFYPSNAEILALNTEVWCSHVASGRHRGGGGSDGAGTGRAGRDGAASEASSSVWDAAFPLLDPVALASQSIDLPTLIRLYINHRPVVGINSRALNKSLAVAASYLDGSQGYEGEYGTLSDASAAAVQLQWGGLAHLLCSKAERMNPNEVRACIAALTGVGINASALSSAQAFQLHEEDRLTAGEFAERVLGFMQAQS
jgi:WD40 repeat protein